MTTKKISFIAFKTIIRKECLRFLRIWSQTFLPSAVTTVLYFIVFGNLIGSRIGEMDGFSYMQFIVPGLIMMSIITNAYSNVASSFFSSKFQRNVEELLVAPVANYIIILGYVGGGVIRAFLVGLLVSLIALIFVDIEIYSIYVIFSSALLTAMMFSTTGFINGILAQGFDGIGIVPVFILTPLTYLGGVFYSINLLAPLWQAISKINPILYMVNAFRYGFLGINDVDIRISFAMLIIFNIIAWLLALHLLKKGTGLRS